MSYRHVHPYRGKSIKARKARGRLVEWEEGLFQFSKKRRIVLGGGGSPTVGRQGKILLPGRGKPEGGITFGFTLIRGKKVTGHKNIL